MGKVVLKVIQKKRLYKKSKPNGKDANDYNEFRDEQYSEKDKKDPIQPMPFETQESLREKLPDPEHDRHRTTF